MKRRIALTLFLSLLITSVSLIAQTNTNLPSKEKFNSNKESEDKIGYAQAVKVGNTIYISGTVGWGKMEDALKIAYDHIEKTLKNYNATFGNVVMERLFSTQLDSTIKHKDIRLKYYGTDFPAATWVEVKRLYSPVFVVEIDVVAVLPDKKEN